MNRTLFASVGLMLMLGQAHAASLPELKAYAESHPQDTNAWYDYAEAANAAGKADEARAAYMHMLDRADMPEAMKLDLALLYARTGHYADAAKIYRNVLAGNPSPEVKANVEQALASLEKLQQAEAPAAPMPVPVPVQKAPPQTLPEALDHALALVQAGRYAEAEAIYRGVLGSNPQPEVKEQVEQALATLAQLRAATPPQEEMQALKSAVEDAPQDMDALFAYAQKAAAQGEMKEAEQAYLKMLELDPSLDRVRLELALLYNKNGDYAKAQPLLEQVIASNPPAPVKEKAEAMLAEAKHPLSPFKRYGLEGSVSAGYNYDSNANSAASTDAISLFDTTVDLPDGAQAQDDGQAFAVGSVGHTYYFAPDAKHPGVATRWYSTGTAYKAEQTSLDELDLIVLSGRTGPVFTFADYRAELGLVLGYNYVKLGGDHYLSVFSGEANTRHMIDPQVALTGALSVEDRSFKNSPILTAQQERSGTAYQITAGAIYTPTQEDSVNGQLLLRQEDAEADYFTNIQYGAAAGYTRTFPYEIFTNLTAGYRESDYDGPDLLISATTRQDKEATAGIAVGKLFEPNILTTIGYQYRNVDSNIQNYNYDNHRFLSSVGIRF